MNLLTNSSGDSWFLRSSSYCYLILLRGILKINYYIFNDSNDDDVINNDDNFVILMLAMVVLEILLAWLVVAMALVILMLVMVVLEILLAWLIVTMYRGHVERRQEDRQQWLTQEAANVAVGELVFNC